MIKDMIYSITKIFASKKSLSVDMESKVTLVMHITVVK